jgi:hypothetical protein
LCKEQDRVKEEMQQDTGRKSCGTEGGWMKCNMNKYHGTKGRIISNMKNVCHGTEDRRIKRNLTNVMGRMVERLMNSSQTSWDGSLEGLNVT